MGSFIAELKRRSVFKVGIAYAIVAWLLIQVIVSVEAPLHLPDWADTFTIILLVIGFPIALILAWAYELTPEGIKPTRTSLPAEGNPQIENQVKEHGEPVTPDGNTIAVLPFTDISTNKDQEYFADGLTEELLNKLSQVKDLQVTGRTSSFYFKGRNEDLRTIGETLGVAYLLEGSVRKSGDQLRITAQLIKAKDGYHLWSETFDRPLKDIFSVQDEIAGAVTTALSIKLGAGVFKRPGMTRNIEAYDLYLQGKANAYHATPDSILVAIDQLRQVVDIDPAFGVGWLGLRRAYISGLAHLPREQSAHYQEKATQAVENARSIAPEIPDLLTITAEEHQNNGDWLAADETLRLLLDKKGHADASVNMSYGNLLIAAGRSNDAIQYLQRAKRLDPLNSDPSYFLAIALLNSNRIDEAVVEARNSVALGMGEILIFAFEFLAALHANDRQRAATVITGYHRLDGDYPNATMLRLAELLVMEDTHKALDELKRLVIDPETSFNTRLSLAHVATILGNPELALKSLLGPGVPGVNNTIFFWHPIHALVRRLPAFKIYLQDIGLVDYWRTTGKWSDYCHQVGDDDFECE